MGICDGRVVVITGAGRGIGRAHALAFAAEGARVVVNDLGAEVDGTGGSTGPAGEVVDMIRSMGGEAVANGDDVASWEGAAALVRTALDAFGGLDTLVCNAGILRDRMLVNMSEEDWDMVMRVHLKGHFCPLRHAGAYWREESKAGRPVRGRVILTSSGAGLYGNVGQLNYGQGGDRHHGAHRRGRTEALRGHGERDRARSQDAHDRGSVSRDDGGAPARNVRPCGPGERLAARGVAGQRRGG